MQEQPIATVVGVDIEVVDSMGIERRRSPDHAMDVVSLVEQELCEVRPILAGDPGDERLLGRQLSPYLDCRLFARSTTHCS